MNSSSNPRKFAEKIAKLHQKEVEQTMAFEQIMAEVIVATRVNGNMSNNINCNTSGTNQGLASNQIDSGSGSTRPISAVQNQVRSSEHHLHINQSVANCRAESLPNVNYMGSNSMCQNSVDLQSALNNLEEMRRGASPAKDRQHRRASPGRSSQQGHRRSDITSPYATPYLSPPDPWRRTNSDSAIHQSSLLPSSSSTSRRSPVHVGSLHGLESCQSQSSGWADPGRGRQYMSQQNTGQLLSPSQQELRPKSCEVPNITVNLTQDEPGVHHIPLAGNTGSLPDLTSFHFPAPLCTPIDGDDVSVSASISNSQSSQYQTQSNSNCGSPFSNLHPGSMTYSPPPDMMSHQPMNQRNNLVNDPLNGASLLSDSDLVQKSSSSCVPLIEIYPSQEEINNCITASLVSTSTVCTNFQVQSISSSSTAEAGCDQQQQQQPQAEVTTNGHWSQYQSSPASPFLGTATDSPYSNCGSPFSPQSSCSALGHSPSSPLDTGSNADLAANSQNSLLQNDAEAFRRINLYEDEIELHEDSTCEVN